MKTTEISLKPCPFCGGDAAMMHDGARTWYSAKCTRFIANEHGEKVRCPGNINAHQFHSADGAAAAWNTRYLENES